MRKHTDNEQYEFQCEKCKLFISPDLFVGYKKYYRRQSYNYHIKTCKKGEEDLINNKEEPIGNEAEQKKQEKEELKNIDQEIVQQNKQGPKPNEMIEQQNGEFDDK